MRVGSKGDPIGRVIQEPSKPAPHVVRFLESFFPDVVDRLRSIQPRLLLRLKRYIGPRLVRMSREQNPFGDPEATVMLGELFGIDHSSERIAQRSGKAG